MNQKDALQKVIYKARWVDGIKNAEIVTDESLAEEILKAGFALFPVIEEPDELRKLEPGMSRGPLIVLLKDGSIHRVGSGISATDDRFLTENFLPCMVLWGTE